MEPPVTTESRRRRQSAAPAAAAALERPLAGRTPAALPQSLQPSASGSLPAAVAMAAGSWLAGGAACQRATPSHWPRLEKEGGADEAMEGGEASGGLLQQILSLRLVPRSGNGTAAYSNPLAAFSGAAIAGVYRAAGKNMIPFEALILGVGQTFCVVVVSFLRILATL
ncbi:transmembrane protein 170A isoform X3 [Oxyura jamaicensis]|uniref:transmembrane protein 170A isoform X3 n=1 Tax=Oxyura jamaicensis TaxID=8884 RepID=UPI0015A50EEA|nr:transmembrane protein 170A isoform X3 [Oxyura jamaicensis]